LSSQLVTPRRFPYPHYCMGT